MDSRKNFLLRWRRDIQRLISQSLASLGTSCITIGLDDLEHKLPTLQRFYVIIFPNRLK